jgi:hypothetical protein
MADGLPFILPKSKTTGRLSSCRAFQLSCNPAFLPSGLKEGVNICIQACLIADTKEQVILLHFFNVVINGTPWQSLAMCNTAML